MALSPPSSRSSLKTPATITAAAATQVPLSIQGAPGQTADLLDVIGAGGGIFSVLPEGNVVINSNAVAQHTLQVQPFVIPDAAHAIAQFLDASGTTYVHVSRSAYLVIRASVAAADAELAANELAFWFDPTNGASALKVKAKQADGTVKTATVALA